MKVTNIVGQKYTFTHLYKKFLYKSSEIARLKIPERKFRTMLCCYINCMGYVYKFLLSIVYINL
jgi:hypothetical protein